MLNTTIINSTIIWGYIYNYANITFSNSSVTSAITLSDFSFASFISGTYIEQLNVLGSAGYYKSPDSIIANGP
jgi:hypothetical protein